MATDIVLAVSQAWDGPESQFTELAPTRVLKQGDKVMLFFEIDDDADLWHWDPNWNDFWFEKPALFWEINKLAAILDHQNTDDGNAPYQYDIQTSPNIYCIVLKDGEVKETCGEGIDVFISFNLGDYLSLH